MVYGKVVGILLVVPWHKCISYSIIHAVTRFYKSSARTQVNYQAREHKGRQIFIFRIKIQGNMYNAIPSSIIQNTSYCSWQNTTLLFITRYHNTSKKSHHMSLFLTKSQSQNMLLYCVAIMLQKWSISDIHLQGKQQHIVKIN
jgi:hypothetical protein